MRSLVAVVASAGLVIGVIGGIGCGSDAPIDLDTYFIAKPYDNAACNNVDQRLAGQREMRLYVNGGVSLSPVTQGLASYYHRHALSFFTAMPPQRTTMAYALDTNETALDRELTAAFPGVDLSDEQAVMASDPVLYNQIVIFVANFILRPMVDFANTHSDVGSTMTNLLVVPQLERPGGTPLGEPGSSLAGLAISPALLAAFARTMPQEAQIWQGVNLPPDFTPMMVLGNNVLARARALDPVLDDLITSHEFGHAGALVHSTASGNLMLAGVTPGLDDCTDSLNDTQLMTLGYTYGLGSAAASAALVARGIGALPPESVPLLPSRPLSSVFPPDRLRALLAGDQRAMRSFVELLFHPTAPTAPGAAAP
jgi:hypothetical protein